MHTDESQTTPCTGSEAKIDPDTGADSALTARELQTLKLIADGMANKEIAFELSISVKTVSFHRENIKSKLGLRSIAQLTRYAIYNGIA